MRGEKTQGDFTVLGRWLHHFSVEGRVIEEPFGEEKICFGFLMFEVPYYTRE